MTLLFLACALLAAVHLASAATCTAGKFSGDGTDDNGQCVNCPRGFSQPQVGRTQCMPCMPGQYQDDPGLANCKACQIGMVSGQAGGIACVMCGPGMFSPRIGSASCIDCAAGKFQNQPSQPNCKNCAKNTFSNLSGQIACTACPDGQVAEVEMATYCHAAAANISSRCTPGLPDQAQAPGQAPDSPVVQNGAATLSMPLLLVLVSMCVSVMAGR